MGSRLSSGGSIDGGELGRLPRSSRIGGVKVGGGRVFGKLAGTMDNSRLFAMYKEVARYTVHASSRPTATTRFS